MSNKFLRTVKIADLQLGDVVQLSNNGPFLNGIVEQITESYVRIFRPYATTSDFSYSNGKVIPYIGIETIDYFHSDKSTTFTLWQRKGLKDFSREPDGNKK